MSLPGCWLERRYGQNHITRSAGKVFAVRPGDIHWSLSWYSICQLVFISNILNHCATKLLSFLCVCLVNTIYLLSFVETPRKFIIAELSIRKLGSSSVLRARIFISGYYYSTDEDPSLRIESSAIRNLRGVPQSLTSN